MLDLYPFLVLHFLHFKSCEIARPILSLVLRKTQDHLPSLVQWIKDWTKSRYMQVQGDICRRRRPSSIRRRSLLNERKRRVILFMNFSTTFLLQDIWSPSTSILDPKFLVSYLKKIPWNCTKIFKSPCVM